MADNRKSDEAEFDKIMQDCKLLARMEETDGADSEAFTVFRGSIVEQFEGKGYSRVTAEKSVTDLVHWHRKQLKST